MSTNSTIIKGDATDEVCLDHATFMLLDNYQKDPGLLQPESAAAMREIDKHYDRVTTANIGVELDSGFYATLYTPKGGNTCPPTLALRGTVFDDARGIALMIKVKAYPAFDPSKSQEFTFGFAPGYEAADAGPEGTSTLQKFGFIDKLTQHGTWLELFSTQKLNTRATSRLELFPLLPATPMLADYREVVFETTLELWLNRDEGDWATNVIQGIGQRTLQYGAELKAAVDDAMDVADGFEKQLRITGHSLGGGMASAAAIYAKKKDPEMAIYGLGYDAAGVHPNTAKNLNTSIDLASDAKVAIRAVEDEVLTSMEKTADFVPLASSLIRYTGSSMPPPIGTFFPKKGISPGPLGNSWAEGSGNIVKGHQYAPKWSQMPNLLRIEDQDLIPKKNGKDPLATFGDLAGHFASALNVSEALENLNAEIARRVKNLQDARAGSETAEEQAERASEAADALREAAAERAEAATEAAAEAAEAEAERVAAAEEAAAEAAEPTGFLGYVYNKYYDNPRDAARSVGRGLSELGDEIGDLGSAAADEIGDLGRAVVDEVGDGVDNVIDATGDGLNYAYEHSAQFMVEFVKYGADLAGEAKDFGALFGAIAAYHDMELATFTFAIKKPGSN